MRVKSVPKAVDTLNIIPSQNTASQEQQLLPSQPLVNYSKFFS